MVIVTTHNIPALTDYLNTLVDATNDKVIKYTMADIGKQALSDVKDSMTQSYNISKGKIPIKSMLGDDGISAILYGDKRQWGYDPFRPVQDAVGVSVSIKRGSTETKEHAFLATMPGGHKGAFRRIGKDRFPIKEYFSVSFPSLLQTDWIQSVINMSVEANADEIFQKKFEAFAK